MEFRFVVPALFLVVLLILFMARRITALGWAPLLVVALLLYGNYHHEKTFVTQDNRLDSISDLIQPQSGATWDEVGLTLGKAFDFNPDVVMATTAAGKMPYYSKLTTVDMLGLNDRWIARHGEPTGFRMPGHLVKAPLRYLIERQVNLVVAYPWYKTPGVSKYSAPVSSLSNFTYNNVRKDELPDDAQLLEIPVNPTTNLVVLYLTRSAIVDQKIASDGWVTHDLY